VFPMARFLTIVSIEREVILITGYCYDPFFLAGTRKNERIARGSLCAVRLLCGGKRLPLPGGQYPDSPSGPGVPGREDVFHVRV
jgi:hypothetical protein